MKKLKHLKKIGNSVDEFVTEIKKEIDKLKKEHQKQIILSNTELLNRIAEGENLDKICLIDKYLDKKDLKKSKDTVEEEEEKDCSEESTELLSHMTFKGKDFFFEDKESGKVYDDKSNQVGVFNLGKIKFDS